MATLTAESALQYYYTYSNTSNGAGGTLNTTPTSTTSKYLGGESSRVRVVGYKIEVPNTGISTLSFTISASSYETGYSSHTSAEAGKRLAFIISTSTTPPLPSTTSAGTITATNSLLSSNTITCSLTPNTTYYLWVYSTSYYQGYWGGVTKASITYQGGVVRIYTSNGWKQAIPYIYTPNGWKQVIPYIYTSNGWKNTC